MNRRKFFKRFAIGTAAIIVAPKVIAEVTKSDQFKNLYYPSMSEITLDRFKRYVNELKHENNPNGIFYVYGTGSDAVTALGFAIYCVEMKKKGKKYDSLLMFHDESGPFPTKK